MSLLTNSEAQYSVVAKCLHWLSALAVVFLFALGLWMVGLDYYHAWYQKAPSLHIGVGVSLVLLTLVRLLYRSAYSYPKPIAGNGSGRKLVVVAKAVHGSLYALLLVLFATGYLIVTAEGEPLSVFGLIEVPAVIRSDTNLQDQAGELHEWLAFVLIGLAAIHGCAALWHHFKNRDNTLLRMVSRAKPDRDRASTG